MSETTPSTPNFDRSRPELLPVDRVLTGGRSIILSPDYVLYEPGDIGIAEVTEHHEPVSVIGAVTMPASGIRNIAMLILKIAGDGKRPDIFGLAGLDIDTPGKESVTGKFVQLEPGSPLYTGRNPGSDSNNLKDVDLWRQGKGYGGKTSLRHARIDQLEQGISITGFSPRGTGVIGAIAMPRLPH